ncbi:IS1 family transposase [Enterobacter sp. CPE_E222]|uniref:IS1 family transposase n=1 Tax=Enterobacter sp. CPE_E222 TaxID=3383890 RepID=UPI0039753F6B
MLQWLCFISCPSCSATDGVLRNGKSTTDISAISALTAKQNIAAAVHLHHFSTRYARKSSMLA